MHIAKCFALQNSVCTNWQYTYFSVLPCIVFLLLLTCINEATISTIIDSTHKMCAIHTYTHSLIVFSTQQHISRRRSLRVDFVSCVFPSPKCNYSLLLPKVFCACDILSVFTEEIVDRCAKVKGIIEENVIHKKETKLEITIHVGKQRAIRDKQQTNYEIVSIDTIVLLSIYFL